MNKAAFFLIPLGIISAFTALKSRPQSGHNYIVDGEKKNQVVFYKSRAKNKVKKLNVLIDSNEPHDRFEGVITAPIYLRSPASEKRQ